LASGLARVPPAARDPLRSTTFGCGQLVAGLLGLGAGELLVGLGGSGTCDGGLGFARALGYRFLAADGSGIEVPSQLPGLARIAAPAVRPWDGMRVRALCDVRSPLLGPSGSARVFGPQKLAPGAPDAELAVTTLERALERMAERMAGDLGWQGADAPGSGAAGGLGAGLAAFADATLESGAGHFLELAGIPRLLAAEGTGRIDAVLTGEGSYDAQSGEGKVAGELRALCHARGVPLAVVAGSAPGEEGSLVFTGAALGPAEAPLDEEALGALARHAVDRLVARATSRPPGDLPVAGAEPPP
nr:glycerate kinase [Gemmatimonadota bacterium]